MPTAPTKPVGALAAFDEATRTAILALTAEQLKVALETLQPNAWSNETANPILIERASAAGPEKDPLATNSFAERERLPPGPPTPGSDPVPGVRFQKKRTTRTLRAKNMKTPDSNPTEKQDPRRLRKPGTKAEEGMLFLLGYRFIVVSKGDSWSVSTPSRTLPHLLWYPLQSGEGQRG